MTHLVSPFLTISAAFGLTQHRENLCLQLSFITNILKNVGKTKK